MAATIRDIRDRTGLSLATISKYLNGGNVLPRNRELIEKAIEELHYEVNELARGLVTNRTKTIGVLVYDIQCTFIGNMLHYLGQTLHENGYGMLICDSCNDEEIEKNNLQFLLSRKVDGILVFAVSLDGKFLESARKAGVPVVLIDRALRNEEYDCVEIDNRAAMMRAAKKLIGCGHRKIAVIASNVEYTGMERMKGFDDALADAGIVEGGGCDPVGLKAHPHEVGLVGEVAHVLFALGEGFGTGLRDFGFQRRGEARGGIAQEGLRGFLPERRRANAGGFRCVQLPDAQHRLLGHGRYRKEADGRKDVHFSHNRIVYRVNNEYFPSDGEKPRERPHGGVGHVSAVYSLPCMPIPLPSVACQ